MQTAMLEHKRGARFVGGHQSIAETQRFTERQGGRLLRENRVRSGFDGEAVNVLGANDAAHPAGRLEELKGHPPNHQLVRGCQPRAAAANDRDHKRILTLTGSVVRDPGCANWRVRMLEAGSWELGAG